VRRNGSLHVDGIHAQRHLMPLPVMLPRVIAHRGASGTCPENTLAAFRQAVAFGATMIELDVQLTRDDAVVVLHDDTLDRTTDGRGLLRRKTLADVRRLDAGAWFAPEFAGERVPTLAEVLRDVAVAINVELKSGADDGLEARALDLVQAAGAGGRVVWSSFDWPRLERLRRLDSSAEVAVLCARTRRARALDCVRRVGARALHVRNGADTPAWIAAGHDAGLLVRVWTVNSQAHFSRLASAGADAVFTDFPERFLQPVRAPGRPTVPRATRP
jgi:glycerophosphoryl diester phosphodiesterase